VLIRHFHELKHFLGEMSAGALLCLNQTYEHVQKRGGKRAALGVSLGFGL
jgi:hypothetical protein